MKKLPFLLEKQQLRHIKLDHLFKAKEIAVMENSISLVIHSIIIYPCELKHHWFIKTLTSEESSGDTAQWAKCFVCNIRACG